MKRGFLEACVLAAVSGEESYGYQIVKDVPASMGLTESTLYPLLKRLEKAGCITARSAEHNGRLRRYYRITDAGRERIAEFLAEWPSVQEIYRYVEGAHHDARLVLEPAGRASGLPAGRSGKGNAGVLRGGHRRPYGGRHDGGRGCGRHGHAR